MSGVVDQSSNFHFGSDKTDWPFVVNGTSRSSSKIAIQVPSRASGRKNEKRELLSITSQYGSFSKTRIALVDRKFMALQWEKHKTAKTTTRDSNRCITERFGGPLQWNFNMGDCDLRGCKIIT